ncbi:MAG: phosphotransferase family protein [Dehalococcoidia bacterium]
MDEMQGLLQAYYASSIPSMKGAQVSDLTSLSSGWESDVYSFELAHGPGEGRQREQLILRIYPGNDARDKSAREFQGMRELHEAGYPVPEVLILERDESPFGKPFVIMERIEGQLLWPLLSGAPAAEQRRLLTLFCQLLVRLHQLDWQLFTPDNKVGAAMDSYAPVEGWLKLVYTYLERFPSPGYLPLMQWLEARKDRVPCIRPAPIHWDFHPGNVLLRDDGAAVVSDWTQFELSDHRFDLAWTLLLLATHASEEWRDFVLEEYERLAGNPVEQLDFFEVAACVKRLLAVSISLSYGPEQLGMRADAVSAMESQLPALSRVYQLLQGKTGLEVPELNRIFAGHS